MDVDRFKSRGSGGVARRPAPRRARGEDGAKCPAEHAPRPRLKRADRCRPVRVARAPRRSTRRASLPDSSLAWRCRVARRRMGWIRGGLQGHRVARRCAGPRPSARGSMSADSTRGWGPRSRSRRSTSRDPADSRRGWPGRAWGAAGHGPGRPRSVAGEERGCPIQVKSGLAGAVWLGGARASRRATGGWSASRAGARMTMPDSSSRGSGATVRARRPGGPRRIGGEHRRRAGLRLHRPSGFAHRLARGSRAQRESDLGSVHVAGRLAAPRRRVSCARSRLAASIDGSASSGRTGHPRRGSASRLSSRRRP